MKSIFEKSTLSFSDRLRAERKRLALSQEEFGRLGGVTRTAVWLYEAGKNWPTAEFLESLRMNDLDVDVGFIVTGVRQSKDHLDWVLLRNAFLLIQHTFAERTDRKFTADQLFEAFKSVVEAATGVTRPDLLSENIHTPKEVLEQLSE